MDEQTEVLEYLTLAVLESASRNRQVVGGLAFQGGNALKYAYGSARASVDIDFLTVAPAQAPAAIVEAAGALARQWAVYSSHYTAEDIRTRAHKKNDERNPQIFEVVCGRHAGTPDWRVKVEFYRCPTETFDAYAQTGRPARGRLVSLVSPMLPTATASEILADKLHAIANRRYLKARDFFDVDWLMATGLAGPKDLSAPQLLNHMRMYGDEAPRLGTLANALGERIEQAGQSLGALAEEVSPFLPLTQTAEEAKRWVAATRQVHARVCELAEACVSKAVPSSQAPEANQKVRRP